MGWQGYYYPCQPHIPSIRTCYFDIMEFVSEDISEDLLGSETEADESESEKSTIPTEPTQEALYPAELDEENINKRNVCCKWAYTDYDLTRIRFADAEVKYKIEGNEVCPSTGRKHIQGFVWLKKAVRWTALKAKFPDNMRFVPARGSPWQNFVYCSKEGNFTEVGDRPKEPKKKQDANIAFKEALEAATIKEGMDIIKEKRARDFCLYGDTIERALKKSKYKPFKPEYAIEDFNIPAQNLSKPLLFCGPTNIGKTQFALAHFREPLLVSHMDDLKKLQSSNDGIVFDDMSFDHIPPRSVIHLLDNDCERSLHVRYGTVTIPARTKKIFTSNTDNPFYKDEIDNELKEAIKRRFNRINFYSTLYNTKK